MLRSRSKQSSPAALSADSSPAALDEWEVRPGGMLVQKRNPDSPAAAAAEAAASVAPVSTIRVRVKHEAAYLDVYLSSQSTFGELKKLLAERTGLHPLDQRLVYKGKDRDSAAYLDIAGVKDRSKLVLMEDPTARAKRVLEMRREAWMEKATKSISQISLEVDKLAVQVSALDKIVSKGGKVAEKVVLDLIELLMTQLIKLDGIPADGEAKKQRGIQVRRVQKYVERLDVLQIKNSAHRANAQQQQLKQQKQQHHQPQQRQQQSEHPQPAVIPTKVATLDFFDSLFEPYTPSTASTAKKTATPASSASSAPIPRFDWELF